MQKCKVFQTALWRTLQITYRLVCDDEGCNSDREGLKRVASSTDPHPPLSVRFQYIQDIQRLTLKVVFGSFPEVQ